jgi:gamma-glutamylputrescine oxidase
MMDLLTANDEHGQYPKSYYAATASPMAPFASAKGEISCDVCVVGGGYTGISAALHLAREGFDVVLLDAQRLGFGASGRNGGQVSAGQRVEQDALEKMVGQDAARILWDLSIESVRLVRELIDDEKIDCGWSHGIIHAMHRARYVPEDHEYIEKLRREYAYEDMLPLDQAEMNDLVGSKAYYGGSLDKGAGHLHPLRFVLGLAKAAHRAGVRIFESSKVVDIVDEPAPLVKTEHAQVKACYVVLGCNGYLGDLKREVATKVMPINNYIAATEPLTQDMAKSLIRDNHAVADSKFVINYFRLSEDNRMLFGGGESYGYHFPVDIATKVRKPMLEIFPQLANTKIDYAWGGTLGITVNRMPHFARLSKTVFSASGYSGHGVAMATLGGKFAADAIAGRAKGFDALADVPTMRFPGGVIARAPLLALAMFWFSLRDKF